MQKTNAMRLLDQAKVPYTALSYAVDESDLSGVHVAATMGRQAGEVYKTLVLKGVKAGYFVCCIPSDREIDLKKAASAAGDKKVEMIPVKDILAVTGYIRGGCSPFGMKKKLPTWVDAAVLELPTVVVSAGVRGGQIELEPQHLLTQTGGKTADLVKEG